MEITGVLNVNNALVPQDVEVTPGAEDITVEPDEGCYLRSVVVKAISPVDDGSNTDNDTPSENTGD